MNAARTWTVFRDELRLTLRRPMVWIMFVVGATLLWGISAGHVGIGIGSGDSQVGGKKQWLSSEFVITQVMAVTSYLILMYFAAAAAGTAVIRDAESRVLDLLNSTPLKPSEYVWGKFLGVVSGFALVMGLLLAWYAVLLHVLPNAGMVETRGPFDPLNYARPFFAFALPILVFSAGVAFAIGAMTRRAILVFLLPIALVLFSAFFLWTWTPSWLPEQWNRVLQFADFAGVRWLGETWLEVDRGADFYNNNRVGYDRVILGNRAVIVLLPLLLVAWTARRHARLARGLDDARPTGATAPAPETTAPRAHSALASLGMVSAKVAWWRSALVVARAEARELRSQPGLYLFVPLILIQMIGSAFVAVGAFDTPLLNTSGTLAVDQMNYLTTLLTLLLLFYGVESLERERTGGLGAIQNTMPVTNASLVAGKVVALGAVWLVLVIAGLVAAVIVILVQGKMRFTLAPFALTWGVLTIPTLFFWLSFVFATYAITRNRFSTYGVALALYAWTAYLALNGKMTWLLNWPLWGAVRWSDMSVFEYDRAALIWNRLFVLGLGVVFWRIAVRRFPRADVDATRAMQAFAPRPLFTTLRRAIPVLVLPLIAGIMVQRLIGRGPQGGAAEKVAKDYWKKNHATWLDWQEPWLKDLDLAVRIEPAARAMQVRGTYTIVNHRDTVLRTLPLTVGNWRNLRWTVDGDSARPDTTTRLHVFSLERALGKGDSVRIGMSYDYVATGTSKRGGGSDVFIEPSGVVIHSFDPRFFPMLGYLDQVGVDDDNRYEPRTYPEDFHLGVTPAAFGYALPATARLALDVPADFTANGVGERLSEEVRDGRRLSTWKTDRPVMAFSIVAGRYAVRRGKGTALFHHPEHTVNVEEMGQALDAARQYFGTWFGEYPWKELKISEFPALAAYAQGFPTNITFAEGIGFLTKSEPKTNLAFLVTAHEIAHQWWGNMLTPGRGPSGNLLSEGMAHFSTALLIEQVKGERAGIEFRKRIEERYGDTRRADAERKLFRVDGSKDGDGTLWYDKGGWVFWMLADRMGRDRALDGMQALIARYQMNDDHPVLRDFVEHMRAYATDTAGYDDFVRQWMDSVVVPEYRVREVRSGRVGTDSLWETTATVENVGTGTMPIDVAVVRGERFPDDTAKGKAKPWRDARTRITLAGKASATVRIRSPFAPEKVVVDPDVRVLQLRRKSAEGKVEGS